jgi:hypothetical protein
LVGTDHLSKKDKRQVAQAIGLPPSAGKDAMPNSGSWDPSVTIGLQPGIVGPLFEPRLSGNLSGICYIEKNFPPGTPVEIALYEGPLRGESLAMRKEDFEWLLGELPYEIIVLSNTTE